jgi:feruloyl esterase
VLPTPTRFVAVPLLSHLPNITAFVEKGGKMIHYVGGNDQYLSAYESEHWYNTVDAYMSTHTNYTTSVCFTFFPPSHR